jgi:hypothetical protein
MPPDYHTRDKYSVRGTDETLSQALGLAMHSLKEKYIKRIIKLIFAK